jgi:hypothetical protein
LKSVQGQKLYMNFHFDIYVPAALLL